MHVPSLVVFLVLALGLPWLATLPLYMDGGLRNPATTLLIIAMQTAPTIGALVVTFGVLRPAHSGRYLGLVPVRPWRRVLGYSLLGFVGALVGSVLAIVVGSLAGVTPLAPAPGALSQIALVPVLTVGLGITLIGEEIGWRGFLLPALQPLGTVPSLLLNGIVWGLWHTPLLLLGYNFGTTSPVSVPLMMVGTTLIGTMLAWLRFRSGSIWAGVVAHGTLNASASLLLIALVPKTPDVTATVLGWAGWIVLAVVIGVVAAVGGFRGFRIPGPVTQDRRDAS